MGKSLYEKVKEDIWNREKHKRQMVNETLKKSETDFTKAQKAFTEVYVIKAFEKALEKSLLKFEEYEGHKMSKDGLYEFEKVVQELGFVFDYHYGSSKPYYLKVPELKEGKIPTLAQLKLINFKKGLSRLQKEREEKLLVECQRIEQDINKGYYFYKIINLDDFLSEKIIVKAMEKAKSDFELGVIRKFLSKLGFKNVRYIYLRNTKEHAWEIEL